MRVLLLLIGLGLTLGLGGCGKKGDPVLPPGVHDERQPTYPDPSEAQRPAASPVVPAA